MYAGSRETEVEAFIMEKVSSVTLAHKFGKLVIKKFRDFRPWRAVAAGQLARFSYLSTNHTSHRPDFSA